MPKFKVVTEPMAEVTLSWNEISTIIDGLEELKVSGGSLTVAAAGELVDFFYDVRYQMGEAA